MILTILTNVIIVEAPTEKIFKILFVKVSSEEQRKKKWVIRDMYWMHKLELTLNAPSFAVTLKVFLSLFPKWRQEEEEAVLVNICLLQINNLNMNSLIDLKFPGIINMLVILWGIYSILCKLVFVLTFPFSSCELLKTTDLSL